MVLPFGGYTEALPGLGKGQEDIHCGAFGSKYSKENFRAPLA